MVLTDNFENNNFENDNLENNNSSIIKINILPGEIYHSNYIYNNVTEQILRGNLKEDGGMIENPDKLLIDLKIHQKRMIYEMIRKEELDYRISNKINAFILADKVGSGKSMDVLGLICNSVNVKHLQPNKLIYKVRKGDDFKGFEINSKLEFQTNLIVVPHGIYYQWIKYITENTKLTYYFIANTKDIHNIPFNNMINGKCDILLVKSTKYNDLMKEVYKNYPCNFHYKANKKILGNGLEKDTFYNTIYNLCSNLREQNYNIFLLEGLIQCKDLINNIDMDGLKKNIEKMGKYTLDNILEYTGPIFQRVFFDEVNSIKIPSCMWAIGKINWFITSSVQDLLYAHGKYDYSNSKILINGIRGSGFIKDIFYNNCGPRLTNFVQDMYLKNNDNFVDSSFKLPDPIHSKIECFTPNAIKALNGLALPEIIQALNAGDLESAIQKLNCTVSTEEDIVKIYLKNMISDLEKKEKILSVKNTEFEKISEEIDIKLLELKNLEKILENEMDQNIDDSLSDYNLQIKNLRDNINEKKNNKSNIKKSIKTYNEQVSDLNFKIESLKSRITDIKNKKCPICSLTVTNPVITPCCKNIFCFSCLAQALYYCSSTEKKVCPFCRHRLDIKDVTYINDNNFDEKKNNSNVLPTKLDCLVDLIKSNDKGKFLVFSEYENSFNEIINILKKNDILYNKLCGSTGHIKNIINSFSNNQINVLLMNAKHFGSGLNLQMTTDIILYHRMSHDLEKQIIGRGQRPGRTCSLRIKYLCYENELYN